MLTSCLTHVYLMYVYLMFTLCLPHAAAAALATVTALTAAAPTLAAAAAPISQFGSSTFPKCHQPWVQQRATRAVGPSHPS